MAEGEQEDGLAPLRDYFRPELAPVHAVIVDIRRFVVDSRLVYAIGEAMHDDDAEDADVYEGVLWDGVEGSELLRCIFSRNLNSLLRNYCFRRGVTIEITQWQRRMSELPLEGQPNYFTYVALAEARGVAGPELALPPCRTTSRERPLAGQRCYFVHHFCDDCFVGEDWAARPLAVEDEELDGMRWTTVKELARSTVPPPRRAAKGRGRGGAGGASAAAKGRGAGGGAAGAHEQEPFLGRVVGKSSINHYARAGEVNKTPYFFTLRLADQWGDTIPVVCWGTTVMKLFGGVRYGDAVLVTGYRAKPNANEPCRLELAVNPGPNGGRVRVLSEGQLGFMGVRLDPAPLALRTIEGPSSLSALAEAAPAPVPPDEADWDAYPPRGPLEEFDFLGIVRHVGRIERVRRYPDSSQDPLRPEGVSAAAASRAAGGSYPKFFAYRWLLLADASSDSDLAVQVFANSQWDSFARLRADRTLLLTRLRLVRGGSPGRGTGFHAVSTGYTQIIDDEDRIPREDPALAEFLEWAHENRPAVMTRPWLSLRGRPTEPAGLGPPSLPRVTFGDLQNVVNPLRWRERRRVLLTGVIGSLRPAEPAPPPADQQQQQREEAPPPPPPPPPPAPKGRPPKGKGRAKRRRRAADEEEEEDGAPAEEPPATAPAAPAAPAPSSSSSSSSTPKPRGTASLDFLAPNGSLLQELALAEDPLFAPGPAPGPSAWLAGYFSGHPFLLPEEAALAAGESLAAAACERLVEAIAGRPALCCVDFSLENEVPWRTPASGSSEEERDAGEDWDGDGGGSGAPGAGSGAGAGAGGEEEGEGGRPTGGTWAVELVACFGVPPEQEAEEP
eukprot:tig00020909_g15373.t1